MSFWEGPTDAASWSVFIDYDTTTEQPFAGLQLLNITDWVDMWGDLHIAGEVHNDGTITANFVKVISTLYNNEGNILNADYCLPDPYNLNPGQSAPFEQVYYSNFEGWATYQLYAEANP